MLKWVLPGVDRWRETGFTSLAPFCFSGTEGIFPFLHPQLLQSIPAEVSQRSVGAGLGYDRHHYRIGKEDIPFTPYRQRPVSSTFSPISLSVGEESTLSHLPLPCTREELSPFFPTFLFPRQSRRGNNPFPFFSPLVEEKLNPFLFSSPLVGEELKERGH